MPIDRLAYAALLYTGETEAEARAGAEKLLWYMTPTRCRCTSAIRPATCRRRCTRDPARRRPRPARGKPANATVDKAIEAGIMFAGTPDRCSGRSSSIYDHVGGFGHLLIMGQAGFLEHDETVRGIKTFAREVYPRLKEAFPDTAISGVQQQRVVA